MKRNIYSKLLEWKNKAKRKPLVILGQRQIGKTYIIKEFGKNEYKEVVYINFMENETNKELFNRLDGYDVLMENICNKYNLNNVNETLFIFDEIQECNNAILSLKLINESQNNIHLICTGSYLGYDIKSSYLNFPIGQIELIKMKQMMFDEFIEAVNKTKVLNSAIKSVKNNEPINDAIHSELIQWFNHYVIIGGFPEVIKTFIESNHKYKNCFEIINQIYFGYLNDINKYSSLFQSKTFLNLIYSNVSNYLTKENKKFIFHELNQYTKFRELEKYLVWLDNSNLLIKVNNLKNINYPISTHTSINSFKLFYNDQSFISLLYKLDNDTDTSKFNLVKGGLYENFLVTQMLYTFEPISYYSFTKHGKRYEIDFVVENKKNTPCLIEVKSSTSFKNNSLNNIESNNKYILSPANFYKNEKYTNIPIYLAYILDELI